MPMDGWSRVEGADTDKVDPAIKFWASSRMSPKIDAMHNSDIAMQ
jgi:hypothetical protein